MCLRHEGVWGSRDLAPHFPNSLTKMRVVRFKICPSSPFFPLNRQLCGSVSQYGRFKKGNISCLFRGSNPGASDFQTVTLSKYFVGCP